MIRAGGEPCEKALCKLFNEVWNDEKFPEEWTKGVLVPIPKGELRGEDRFDTANYRGITMVNILPKLYTSIIYERLSEFCESEKIISEETGGVSERAVND